MCGSARLNHLTGIIRKPRHMNLSKYANAILHNYWNRTLPVDPFVLARASGWNVIFSDNLEGSKRDFYLDPEEKTVYMNAGLMLNACEARVACAKALAYVVTASRESAISEETATGFAAEILIPELFLGLVSDVANSAQHFAVTPNLVTVRRKQMLSAEYSSTTGFLPAALSK